MPASTTLPAGSRRRRHRVSAMNRSRDGRRQALSNQRRPLRLVRVEQVADRIGPGRFEPRFEEALLLEGPRITKGDARAADTQRTRVPRPYVSSEARWIEHIAPLITPNLSALPGFRKPWPKHLPGRASRPAESRWRPVTGMEAQGCSLRSRDNGADKPRVMARSRSADRLAQSRAVNVPSKLNPHIECDRLWPGNWDPPGRCRREIEKSRSPCGPRKFSTFARRLGLVRMKPGWPTKSFDLKPDNCDRRKNRFEAIAPLHAPAVIGSNPDPQPRGRSS